MRTTIIRCLLWVMSASVAVVPAVSAQSLEQDALALAKKNYEQLGKAPKLAVIVMSMQNCIGCAMMAVNNAVSSLKDYDSTIPCAVVVIADDARDVATLSRKLSTPYIVADTEAEHVRYAGTAIRELPALAVFANGIMTRHRNLQHDPPDFSRLFSSANATERQPEVLLAGATNTGTRTREIKALAPLTTLEEPKDRSVKYLMSPVLSSSHDRLYGINHLTNSIEAWDIANGKLLEPIPAPDTLKYFFRKDARDTIWKITETQGYDPARFIALRAVDDTVYALAMLLAGYEREKTVEKAKDGSDSSAMNVYWRTQQVAVKIYGHAMREIIPLPEKYSFIELLADRTGAVGGTCFEAFEEESEIPDSLAVVALLGRSGADRFWKTPTGASPSLGSATMSADGTVWYCDPLQPLFFVSQADGTVKTIKIQKQLANAGSPLMMEAPEDMQTYKPPFPYMLESMKAWGDKVVMMLTPTDTAVNRDRLVQIYRVDGSFLGEHPLRSPVLDKAAFAWLLDVHDNTAFVLVETDKRWQVATVPLTQQ